MSLLHVYNSIHQFDIKCFSETYLGNSYQSYDDQLALPGYSLIRAGNTNTIKRKGVYIYYGETLPIKVINVNILT